MIVVARAYASARSRELSSSLGCGLAAAQTHFEDPSRSSLPLPMVVGHESLVIPTEVQGSRAVFGAQGVKWALGTQFIQVHSA